MLVDWRVSSIISVLSDNWMSISLSLLEVHPQQRLLIQEHQVTGTVVTSQLILGACIAPDHHGLGQGHRNLTGEWVLLDARGLTKGTVIQQVVYHPNGTKTYSPFAVLPETPPAGATQLLALGGHGTPYMEGTRWVIFNGSSQPKLNNKQGETIRVERHDGVVLAEKTFPTNSCDLLPAAPKKVVAAVGGSAAAAAAFGFPE